jgi:chromosomal replication initiator protein
MRITPPGEIERAFVQHYSQVRSRLRTVPASIRVNEPMPEPEVRSEPVAEIIEDIAPAPLGLEGLMAHVAGLAVQCSPVTDRLRCTATAKVSSASIRAIMETVASYYRVTCLDIMSDRRTADIVKPRHVAMYLCCELTHRSMPAIGRAFGDRDHTTILHARTKMAKVAEVDADLAADLKMLRYAITTRWSSAANENRQVGEIPFS